MDKVSAKILNYAVRNEYISNSVYEEYLYMLTMLLNIIVTDITMLLIGLAMHMVWECIVFWLIYKALRKYCGGFHFSTSFRCYLSSCIMCPLVLCMIHFMSDSMVVPTILTMAASATLLILVPVEAVNKPLDEAERAVFGKVARILVVIAAVVYSIMLLVRFYTISKILALGIICVTIFVVAGKIQLVYLKHRHLR